MSRKKIIILYSTAGMGHKKAALALFKAFKAREAEADTEIIDVLDYASNMYKYLYLGFYVFLMSRARWLWGALYYFSDNPIVDALTRKMRSISDFNGLPGLGKALEEKSPDVIVATHFLLPSIAGILKKRRGLTSKMHTLITDYGPHATWISKHIDKFFVGSDSVLSELAKRGISKEQISATGIPTTDEFYADFNAAELRQKYSLEEGKKTIFLMSGGFGVGPIKNMLLSLNSVSADIQVIAVCGHNEAVYNDVQELKEKLKYSLVPFGFTDKVAELMSVSDLMVTKAGGISSTEALNSRLPMILFASLPGQETWNEHFLIENNAAIKAKKIKDIPVMVDEMLSSDETYNSFIAGIDKIRRPDAAERIVDIVLGEN